MIFPGVCPPASPGKRGPLRRRGPLRERDHFADKARSANETTSPTRPASRTRPLRRRDPLHERDHFADETRSANETSSPTRPASRARPLRRRGPLRGRGALRVACEGRFRDVGGCLEGALQGVERPMGAPQDIAAVPQAPLTACHPQGGRRALRVRRPRSGPDQVPPPRDEELRQDHRWIEAQRPEGHPQDIGPCPESAPHSPAAPRGASAARPAAPRPPSVPRRASAACPAREAGFDRRAVRAGRPPGKNIGGPRFNVPTAPFRHRPWLERAFRGVGPKALASGDHLGGLWWAGQAGVSCSTVS
jgi:hypothetical protein